MRSSNPVAGRSTPSPSREAIDDVAGVLAPTGERAILRCRSDAAAHGVDLALIGAAEGIVALDLSHEGHAPPSLVRSVFAFAPSHGAGG